MTLLAISIGVGVVGVAVGIVESDWARFLVGCGGLLVGFIVLIIWRETS